MSGVVIQCSDSSTDDQSTAETETEVSHKPMETIHVHTPARTARELVKGQETLLGLLQDLRCDLARMDREASRIKDDVMRSKQIFPHPMLAVSRQNHQFPATYVGYRSLPSNPATYRRRDVACLDMTYLNQLPTRSSRSSTPSRVSERRRRESDDSWRSDPGHRSSIRTTLEYSTDDTYSGAESDLESSSCWSRDSISRDGSSVSLSGPCSSTLDRRSSYFYAHSSHASTRQDISDDNVEL